MKQQTAVDSVIEYFSQYVDMKKHVEEIEKFKDMEKERRIEFGELCWKNLLRSDVIMRPRDVYNETYGGNK